MNEMQRIAYAMPITEPHKAQNPRYFRSFDRHHAVGLTANK